MLLKGFFDKKARTSSSVKYNHLPSDNQIEIKTFRGDTDYRI